MKVEEENTHWRQYFARLHRKTLCYSSTSLDIQGYAIQLLHYPHFGGCCASNQIHLIIQQRQFFVLSELY